jgi:phosphatidylethanolamine/phosphatidyl-N-methylethanolamine N-methyltransferase
VLADLAFFLKQAVLQPKQTSALAPSSKALARAMAQGLGPDSGPVVEFGPGTGRITQAILDTGVRPENLTLFEMNPEFAAKLRIRFPDVAIHVTGAQNVGDFLPATVGNVISGLPLLSMPRAVRHAIVLGGFSVLRPGGRFVQFTYGSQPPLSDATQQSLCILAERGVRVWGNLPPARIYILRRIAD